MKPVIVLTAALVFAIPSAYSQTMRPDGVQDAQSAQLPLAEGEVRKVDKVARELTLKHGDLPSIGMGPMTMAFSVADSAMLEAVKAGDKVRFTADILEGRPTVTKLEVTQE
ncbi:MAG: copper-binding protein [Burkholderiaceae bacterium]|jgi:Cu/Ag efflux protein CusF|nr:copper-binding protein [Burkholderiaceae bacterium]MEB2319210.1 copper-binding protein [Pseudomonadota bacterium]